MIDEETERAVAGWVRLADQVSRRSAPEARVSCAQCGSRDRVLDRADPALCARCYLESKAIPAATNA